MQLPLLAFQWANYQHPLIHWFQFAQIRLIVYFTLFLLFFRPYQKKQKRILIKKNIYTILETTP